MTNKRINKLDMSVQDIIITMSGGNPGALTACMELLSKGDEVDPDAFGGGLNSLFMLDMLGIYEERIFMLWSHICKCDVGKMMAVLYAHQLGQLAGVDTKTLNYAIDNGGAGIDFDAVLEAVKSRLPNFNLEVGAA